MIPLVERAALHVVAVLPSLSDRYHTIGGQDSVIAVAVILPLTARCDTIGGKGSVTCCGCVTIAQRPL